ncbi:MAG TPA: tetratricopeptide repeat protein [Candidatus Binataceae bacterium]|nr:tetratricopeptide repeat protein [Candidatus Binataceae bacterium]
MADNRNFTADGPNRDAKVSWWLGGESAPPPWLARFQPFLTRLGKGDAQSGTWLAAILAATAVLYSRSLGNKFVGDDWPDIANNPYIRDWSFIWKSMVRDRAWYVDPAHLPQSAHYRPLKNIWNALNFHLFGTDPCGYHATLIGLHLIMVWLVFRVAAQLTADRSTALLSAALFALMPVHAEVVSWPTSIEVLLCALFELTAFEFYLRWLSTYGSAERHGLRWRILSLGNFGGALLSYEPAVMFPLLIAVHAFIIGKSDNDRQVPLLRRIHAVLVATWPYAVVLAAYFGLRFWVFGFFIHPQFRGWTIYAPPQIVNSANSGRPLMTNAVGSLWTTVGIVGQRILALIAMYTMLLVVPWLAGPAHPMADGMWNSGQSDFSLLIAGIAAALGILSFSLWPHPHRRLRLFCTIWVPTAVGVLMGAYTAADRWAYLPSFGFCLLIADVAVFSGRESRARAKVVGAVIVVIIVTYASVLFSMQSYWYDDASATSALVEAYPKVAAFHSSLASALEARGDLAAARRQYEESISLSANPDAEQVHYLAHVDQRLGDNAAAARAMTDWFKRLKQPTPDNCIELALADDAAGDSDGAKAALMQAAALPGSAEVTALADVQIRLRHGDHRRCEGILRELLRRHPDNKQALLDLGTVLVADNRRDEALAVYRRAVARLSYAPDIHYKIALLLHQMGRNAEAREECRAALAQAPNDARVQALMSAIGGAEIK